MYVNVYKDTDDIKGKSVPLTGKTIKSHMFTEPQDIHYIYGMDVDTKITSCYISFDNFDFITDDGIYSVIFNKDLTFTVQ